MFCEETLTHVNALKFKYHIILETHDHDEFFNILFNASMIDRLDMSDKIHIKVSSI